MFQSLKGGSSGRGASNRRTRVQEQISPSGPLLSMLVFRNLLLCEAEFWGQQVQETIEQTSDK